MIASRPPLLRVALIVALASAPGGALAQSPIPSASGVAGSLVHFACVVTDEIRDGDPLDGRLVWHVHVDPMECSPGAYSAYVKYGKLETDPTKAYVAVDSQEVEGARKLDPYGNGSYWYFEESCTAVMVTFGQLLAALDGQQEAALGLASAVARLVGERGLENALVPGDVIVAPAPAPASAPEAGAPHAGPVADALQARAFVEPGAPAVDDVAVDSQGTGSPTPTAAPGLQAYRLDTTSSAGPASVDASMDPGPLRSLAEPAATAGAHRETTPASTARAVEPRPPGPALSRAQAPAATAPGPDASGPESGPQPLETLAPAPGVHVASHVAGASTSSSAVRALVAGSAACAIALALAALYHRLTGQKLRKTGPRATILDLLAREPGLLATEIGQRLGLHRTTAEYHLRRLQQVGAVAARPSSRCVAYFLPGASEIPPRPTKPRSPAALAILDLARASPGATIGEAATAARVGLPCASRHAKRLREAGLLDVRADGRLRRLFLP